MLTGFNGRLLLSYISGKKDEHGAPDEVVYTTSKDGMIWEKERVMFPYMLADSSGYIGPDKELLPEHAKMIVHSRMCFYQASDGRMLATTYGRWISRAGSGWKTAIPAVHSPFRTIEARYDSPNDRKAVNCVPCPYTAVSRVALAAAKRAASTLPDRSLRTCPRPAGDPPSRSAGA